MKSNSAHPHKGSFRGAGCVIPPKKVKGWVLCSPCRHQDSVWGSHTNFSCCFFPQIPTWPVVCVAAAQNGAVERQRATELAQPCCCSWCCFTFFTTCGAQIKGWEGKQSVENVVIFLFDDKKPLLCLVAAGGCLIFLVLFRGEISAREVLGFALQGKRSNNKKKKGQK